MKPNRLMNETEKAVNALTGGFKAIAAAIADFAEVAAKTAVAMREFQRAILLSIRREYVSAGKPCGNGYAAMMRWWRKQHPELFEAVA